MNVVWFVGVCVYMCKSVMMYMLNKFYLFVYMCRCICMNIIYIFNYLFIINWTYFRIRLSVVLSVSFLRIVSLVFSET